MPSPTAGMRAGRRASAARRRAMTGALEAEVVEAAPRAAVALVGARAAVGADAHGVERGGEAAVALVVDELGGAAGASRGAARCRPATRRRTRRAARRGRSRADIAWCHISTRLAAWAIVAAVARVRCLRTFEERRHRMHRADRIRNVALVGHRGSGKTSVNEALLYQAGAINRLGSVLDGTTASDSDPDEQARQMSISASLSSFEWDDRKINLIDTPGEPSFVADSLGALRVCESAIFVDQRGHGRRGQRDPPVAARRGARPGADALRQHARPRARRLLPHPGVAEGAPSAPTWWPPRSRSAPSTRCAASSTSST